MTKLIAITRGGAKLMGSKNAIDMMSVVDNGTGAVDPVVEVIDATPENVATHFGTPASTYDKINAKEN